MKKLLAGLCALVFLAGTSLALADRKSNQGDPEEEEEQRCSPTNLSVGYVDNDSLDQHTGSFFPSPLTATATCGPNCVVIGTPGPNGDWDAGVLKIDNPSSTTPLVVQNVTVDIGPVTGIDPWTTFFPQTIPPGGTLILTEDNNLFDFDTSDVPSSAGFPSCIADTFIPVIHVTVGTSTQLIRNFADTTQVLNTGGVDAGLCPVGTHANEGHPFVQLKEVKNHCECEDNDE